MQLTYRGNQYELIASGIATIPGEVIGKYRGATLRASRHAIVSPQSPNLVYRGAHYRPTVNHFEVSGLSNAI